MTPQPQFRFLTAAEVLEIHRRQLQLFGGRPGVRDAGLLDSALVMPTAVVGTTFLPADRYEMASDYLFFLARNRPFNDGNKRVAAHVTQVFLALNGLELMAAPSDYYGLTLAIAEGRAGKVAAQAFLRAHTRPV